MSKHLHSTEQSSLADRNVLTFDAVAFSRLIEAAVQTALAKFQATWATKPEIEIGPEKLALPTEDAAKAIGISPRLLFDETKAGRIKAKRIGSRVVYARSEILRYLNATDE